jgi:cytochrome d ubiquinol oxidase subunit II
VPDLTIEEAATGRATLVAMLVALVAGSLVLAPALVYLYVLFQRSPRSAGEPDGVPAPAAGSGAP